MTRLFQPHGARRSGQGAAVPICGTGREQGDECCASFSRYVPDGILSGDVAARPRGLLELQT